MKVFTPKDVPFKAKPTDSRTGLRGQRCQSSVKNRAVFACSIPVPVDQKVCVTIVSSYGYCAGKWGSGGLASEKIFIVGPWSSKVLENGLFKK